MTILYNSWTKQVSCSRLSKWCTVRCVEVHNPSWNISPQMHGTLVLVPVMSLDFTLHHIVIILSKVQENDALCLCYFFFPLFEMLILALWDGVCCKVVNTVQQQLDEIVHISYVSPQCCSVEPELLWQNKCLDGGILFFVFDRLLTYIDFDICFMMQLINLASLSFLLMIRGIYALLHPTLHCGLSISG